MSQTNEWINITLNGDSWTVYLVLDDDDVMIDADFEAEANFPDREIYIRYRAVNLKVILHELWHAFFGYTYLTDTQSMATSDVEEVSAALFSDRAETIVTLAKSILQQLIEVRDRLNT